MNTRELMWVDESFKKMMKKKAAEYDTSILKLSKMIAEGDNLDEFKRKKNDYRF